METGILRADFDRNTGIEGKTSTKYVAVNTAALIDHFTSHGFTTRQVKGKAVKGKHVVRFQHNNLQFAGIDSYRPEIVVMNSYDGSSTLRLSLGIYRLVCSNGLVVGETFSEYRIRHIGTNTMNEVMIAVGKIMQDAVKLGETVKKFQSITLNTDQRLDFANKAMMSTLSTLNKINVVPVQDTSVLTVRRDADQHNDLWSVLNVVQENITRYGFKALDTKTGKVSNIRSIKSAIRDIQVNKLLWNQAELLAA